MARKKKPDPATDATKGSGAGLVWWSLSWNPALAPVAAFIAAVEGGSTPARQDMQHIAIALRELFCHRDADVTLRIIGRRLGLKHKQGKRGQTAAEGSRGSDASIAIALRERELLAAGLTPARAQSRALREIAQAEAVALRTCQAWWKENRDGSRAFARASEYFNESLPEMVARLPEKSRNENPG